MTKYTADKTGVIVEWRNGLQAKRLALSWDEAKEVAIALNTAWARRSRREDNSPETA